MKSAGWCAYMQSQLEKEQRQAQVGSVYKVQIINDTRGESSADRCPLCGGEMVLRNGKYGTFYGCRNYPLCKGTRKIADTK